MDEEFVSVARAREILGVSKPKMARMIKQGEIPAEENPRDKRYKRVPMSALQSWLKKAGSSLAKEEATP